MKALIAFVIMAVVVLTLIEVNERIKAKRGGNGEGKTAEGESPKPEEPCDTQTDGEDCSACELTAVCEKKK